MRDVTVQRIKTAFVHYVLWMCMSCVYYALLCLCMCLHTCCMSYPAPPVSTHFSLCFFNLPLASWGFATNSGCSEGRDIFSGRSCCLLVGRKTINSEKRFWHEAGECMWCIHLLRHHALCLANLSVHGATMCYMSSIFKGFHLCSVFLALKAWNVGLAKDCALQTQLKYAGTPRHPKCREVGGRPGLGG